MRYYRHKGAVHSEKRFVCQFTGCKYKTSIKSNINNHSVRHSSDRDFFCHRPECGQIFKSRVELMQHIRRMHPKQTLQTSEDIPNKSCDSSQTPDKPYACEWPGCRFTSVHKSAFYIHKRLHKNDKPYVCEYPECGKSFKVRPYLRTHYMRRHADDQ